jgi:hypothetical protein
MITLLSVVSRQHLPSPFPFDSPLDARLVFLAELILTVAERDFFELDNQTWQIPGNGNSRVS